MTAAERLVQLAGRTGTAAALLLAIGTGATAGEALVNYSGLPSGTAAQHLLQDRQPHVEPTFVGGGKKRIERMPAIAPVQAAIPGHDVGYGIDAIICRFDFHPAPLSGRAPGGRDLARVGRFDYWPVSLPSAGFGLDMATWTLAEDRSVSLVEAAAILAWLRSRA